MSKKKYDELSAAKAATDQALAETQANVQTLEEEKDALAAEMEAEKTRMNEEISGIKSDLDATKSNLAQVQEKLNMTEAELNEFKEEINGIFNTYKESGLSLEERDGRLYVTTSEPFNYSSGSSYLSKAERDAIDSMAETLKATPNAKVLIEGHADSQKFAADAGTDNWDLGYARAKAVANRLIRGGVAAAQIALASRGDSMPAADNGTSEGRATNRRAVILPNPDLGNIIKQN
ncbi:OmpA family protein [Flavilitoribacter nigricans]|uniref:OmpA family protein n=1 Tax=Flavilitoribacter nigricans TaxID=70997 RepID=UPI001F406357|nr:OmpA family protein [Flavilitoribacter nigricans]